MDLDVLEEVVVKAKMVEEDLNDLILFNDDVNTFEFVTDTLIEVCGHDLIQAEQCTYLVHYKGKCSVKRGTYKDLEPICVAFLDRGLSAKIE